jgi:hypothetical protein
MSRTFLSDQYVNFYKAAPESMQAYLSLGLPVEYSYEKTDDGYRITGTTRYRCALVDNGRDRVLYYTKGK